MFAAGFIKLGEYVKHPVDGVAPQSPNAVEEVHAIQTPVHKSSSTSRGQVDVLEKAFSKPTERDSVCVFARCEHAEVTPVGGWAIFSRRATRGSLHKMLVGVRYAPEQQSPFCTHLHPRKVMLRRTKRRNKEINEIWTGLCEPVRQNGRTGSQPSVLLVCVRLWVAACVMVGSGVFSE